MRLEELAFFSDLDFLSCVFLAWFLLKARSGEKYWLLYFFLYGNRLYNRNTLCEQRFIGGLCCQWAHHGREVCCLSMSLLQQKYLANSLRLVPECSPSMEAGPRGCWSNNIWSHEAERDEDLFIPGPQSRRITYCSYVRWVFPLSLT